MAELGTNEFVRQAEQKIAEAIIEAANEKPCIRYGFVDVARPQGGEPWRMPRLKRWWEKAIEKRAARAEVARNQEKNRRIRNMIGNGEYVYDGKTGAVKGLKVQAKFQPHTPQEHDMFDAIVRHTKGSVSASVTLSMVEGKLIAGFTMTLPEFEAVPASEHPEARTGIILKSEADAKRAAAAKAAAEAKAKAEAEAKAKAEAEAKAKAKAEAEAGGKK